MKLVVTTPMAVIVEADGVTHVSAEDETGRFGILDRHADFITALAISVVTWRGSDGGESHIAVRGGMLEVRNGNLISIATRDAVPGDDLRQLESDVLEGFRQRVEAERISRTESQRLYLAAIRQICRFVRAERTPGYPDTSASQSNDGFSA
ncbi:MAG: F0F1 ATP synthase subunit epsilon [Rhodobacteraceae bacterium]|nr:F0F1 ATP synthase subunit epsilon [Paracoccaceae bacterium]